MLNLQQINLREKQQLHNVQGEPNLDQNVSVEQRMLVGDVINIKGYFLLDLKKDFLTIN
jgi:hypothetical protein